MVGGAYMSLGMLRVPLFVFNQNSDGRWRAGPAVQPAGHAITRRSDALFTFAPSIWQLYLALRKGGQSG